MEISTFPEKEQILKAITAFSNVSIPQYSESDDVHVFVECILKLFNDTFGLLPDFKFVMSSNALNLPFFRVRELNSIKDINNFSEYSYPQKENASKMGRCNFPSHPVFYCSSNPHVALLECKNQSHDESRIYCISKWVMQPFKKEIVLDLFLRNKLPIENPFAPAVDILIGRISEPFEDESKDKLSKSQKDGLIEFLRFLDSIFIEDKNKSLSAALAHYSLFFERGIRTDILIYPSVQAEHKEVNYAINPAFVDESLFLSRLYIVKLNEIDLVINNSNLSISAYGLCENGQIMWKKANPNDDLYLQMLRDDLQMQ